MNSADLYIVHSPRLDCNHDRNKTGLFAAENSPQIMKAINPLANKQRSQGINQDTYDTVNNYFKKKTLDEILKLHEQRKGFLGSVGLKNYKLQHLKHSSLPIKNVSYKLPMVSRSNTNLQSKQKFSTGYSLDSSINRYSTNNDIINMQLQRAKTTPLLLNSNNRRRKQTPHAHLLSQSEDLTESEQTFQQATVNNLSAALPQHHQTTPISQSPRGYYQPINYDQQMYIPPQAEIDLSQLPHSAKLKQRLTARAFVPGTPLYRHFGLRDKVQQLHQLKLEKDRLSQGVSEHSNNRVTGETSVRSNISQQNKESSGLSHYPHINIIFENSTLNTKRSNNSELSDSEDEFETKSVQQAPPNTSQQKTRGVIVASTPPVIPPRPPLMEKVQKNGTSSGQTSTSNSKPPISRRQSNIDMIVHNEVGEMEEVEIDVADSEVADNVPALKDDSTTNKSAMSETSNS